MYRLRNLLADCGPLSVATATVARFGELALLRDLLADCVRRSSLRRAKAEGVGFEPTEGFPSAVFKTAAFDHSATPPEHIYTTDMSLSPTSTLSCLPYHAKRMVC
jgi:hypothetical protein